MNYALAALFVNNEDSNREAFTYYEERLFETLEEAEQAMNDDYGDELAQAATIDSKNEADLVGFYFSELQAYEVSQRPYTWGELANMNHAEQVARFGWCGCEDNEEKENPFSDCPKGDN
jgi:hypothetical protein